MGHTAIENLSNWGVIGELSNIRRTYMAIGKRVLGLERKQEKYGRERVFIETITSALAGETLLKQYHYYY